MINVVMSPNPKRIKVFLNANGQITPGGVEENLTGSNRLGGNPPTNTTPERDESKNGKTE